MRRLPFNPMSDESHDTRLEDTEAPLLERVFIVEHADGWMADDEAWQHRHPRNVIWEYEPVRRIYPD